MLHLDLTRFVASVGIVLHHSIEFFVPVADRPALTDQTMGLALFVDLFFAISGFVIAYVYHDRALSLRGYFLFLQRRVGRLVPLHWFTLALAIAVWAGFVILGYGGNHPPSFRPDCILDTAVLAHAFVPCGNNTFFNGVSWSISAEMVMYVAAFPVVAFVAARYRWAPVAGLVVSAALLAWGNQIDTLLWWVELHPVVRALPSFCLGAALYYNRNLVAALPKPRMTFVVSMVATFSMMMFGAPHLVTLLLAYLVVASAVAADLNGDPIFFVRRYGPLGQLTYSIYMWHSIVILVLMNALGDKLLHAGPALMLVIGGLCYATIGVVSWFSYVALETPARRWVDGFHLFRPKTAIT